MELKFDLERMKTEKEVSYPEISAATGLATSTIFAITKNRVSTVSLKTLARLCEYFECSRDDLLIWSDGI